jgi:hypothetical protein
LKKYLLGELFEQREKRDREFEAIQLVTNNFMSSQ